ncbi:MAG: hypothetical protein ACRDS9_11680 [Pseudonocardiaceae bacterium]
MAASAAGPQFRVELFERARTKATQTADRCVAECWTDEAVDQQPVAGAGCLLDLMTRQPLVKQVAERDVRLGGGVVLHLLAQPVAEHDGRVLGVSRTGEDELPTSHRVVPAGDSDLVRAASPPDARQVLWSQLPSSHAGETPVMDKDPSDTA